MTTQTKTYSYTQTSDGQLNADQLTLDLCNHFNESVSIENNQALNIFKIHFFRLLNEQESYEVDNIVAVHKGEKIKLRILDLIDPQFVGFMPHKIDFRKHLLPNIHIQKDVSMHLNGRPDYALYKYNNENIARIRFEFESNTFFLMTRRKEILGYYNENDEITVEYNISDEIYNIDTSSYHLTKSMEERSQCRTYVIENMKAILNGFILNYYMSLGQDFMPILNTVSLFFKEYSDSFTTWMQTGAGDFIDKVTNDNLFPFLNLDMTGLYPGTIRQYIVMRINNA